MKKRKSLCGGKELRGAIEIYDKSTDTGYTVRRRMPQLTDEKFMEPGFRVSMEPEKEEKEDKIEEVNKIAVESEVQITDKPEGSILKSGESKVSKTVVNHTEDGNLQESERGILASNIDLGFLESPSRKDRISKLIKQKEAQIQNLKPASKNLEIGLNGVPSGFYTISNKPSSISGEKSPKLLKI